jgi:hypothetical protein
MHSFTVFDVYIFFQLREDFDSGALVILTEDVRKTALLNDYIWQKPSGTFFFIAKWQSLLITDQQSRVNHWHFKIIFHLGPVRFDSRLTLNWVGYTWIALCCSLIWKLLNSHANELQKQASNDTENLWI